MGHYENGRHGGKLPLRCREVFDDAVEAFVGWDYHSAPECPEPTVWLDDEHEELTLSRVCGLVWNCTDRMPTELWVRIVSISGKGPKGLWSYASGARRLLRLVNWRKGRKATVPLPVSPASTETAREEPLSAADEAMAALIEMFSNMPTSSNAKGRKYLLELEEYEIVFQRDELCLAFESAMNEVFGPDADNEGNDIVPQKLSKLFPGCRRS